MAKEKFIYVISTGRCGTQWLDLNLREIYSDKVLVYHEPLSFGSGVPYPLQSYYRQFNKTDVADRVINHYKEGAKQALSEGRHYVETGYPAITLIPYFVERFGDQLKLIHLYRNPVDVGSSFSRARFYHSQSASGFEKQTFLQAVDEIDVINTSWKTNWHHLSPYEKVLFHWLEMNHYALEIRDKYSTIPFFPTKTENMFGNRDELMKLIEYMELPWREKMWEETNRKRDGVKWSISRATNLDAIFKHPDVLLLATKLGYDIDFLKDKAGI